MATHGSAFPIAKLALNNSVPPILMASLRMGIVLILLLTFFHTSKISSIHCIYTNINGSLKFQKKNTLNL